MRFAGYISSALGISVAAIFQSLAADELTRFAVLALPSGIVLIGWLLQLASHLKRFKQWIVADVTASMKTELKKELDKLEESLASRVIDEIWNRLDTIKRLTSYDAKK